MMPWEHECIDGRASHDCDCSVGEDHRPDTCRWDDEHRDGPKW
jgi:hypothetical protein